MDAKIKIGERFPDAKVKDNAGNMKLLSDYVGKGKYVLIDFGLHGVDLVGMKCPM